MYSTRLKAVLVVLGVGVLVLLASLFRLQVLEGARYREEAEERLKARPGFRPTVRGTIYDRRGVALALNTGASDVAVYFPFIEMREGFVSDEASRRGIAAAELRLRVERMWGELARLAGVPREEIEERKQVIRARVRDIREGVRERHGRRIVVREETYRLRRSIPHPLVSDVDLATVGAIRSRPGDFPGVVLLEAQKRDYPYGPVAGHIVGRLDEVTAEELAGSINEAYPRGDLKRYWQGDLVGRGGVEAACEALLRGQRGLFQEALGGHLIEDIAPVAGGDVHLTLDVALQADVEAALDHPVSLARGTRVEGAAVVLDCATGEVLALASSPRYDVNFFRADWPDLSRDPGRPLVNRAIAGQYPLGSVFKAVTATAALHEKVLTPETVLTCTGELDPSLDYFHCHVYPAGHGDLRLREAIKRSCNVFFYQVGQRVGRARLMAWAERLGLGRPVGLGLPGEAGGSVDVADARNLAVGQGEILVTPVQVAQLYGLVATGGRMPRLCLVRELAAAGPRERDLGLDPRHMAVLRDAFAAVVNEQGGTGYGPGKATLDGVRIAGKTGTAQSGRGPDHAWFAGFAPAERARVAFAVIIEHGGHGGETAGPVARKIVEAARAHGYLDSGPEVPEPAASPPAAAPEAVG